MFEPALNYHRSWKPWVCKQGLGKRHGLARWLMVNNHPLFIGKQSNPSDDISNNSRLYLDIPSWSIFDHLRFHFFLLFATSASSTSNSSFMVQGKMMGYGNGFHKCRSCQLRLSYSNIDHCSLFYFKLHSQMLCTVSTDLANPWL